MVATPQNGFNVLASRLEPVFVQKGAQSLQGNSFKSSRQLSEGFLFCEILLRKELSSDLVSLLLEHQLHLDQIGDLLTKFVRK